VSILIMAHGRYSGHYICLWFITKIQYSKGVISLIYLEGSTKFYLIRAMKIELCVQLKKMEELRILNSYKYLIAIKYAGLVLFIMLSGIIIPFYNILMINSAAAEQAENNLDIIVQDGILTVNARNRTLEEVLYAIGEKVGFEVNINGKLDSQTSTWSIDNIPLSKAIRSLVGRHNIVMNYDSPEGEESGKRVSKLWVFGHTEVTANTIHFQGETRQEGMGAPDQFDQTTQSNQEQEYEDTDEQSYIKHLSKILKDDDDSSLRLQAVDALREIGGAQASEALAMGLNDSDPAVRIEVINSLGYIGADNVVPITGQVLFGDADPDVRLAAVQVIAEQDSEVSKVFLKVALEDKSNKVREMAKSILLNSQ
jgi:hypothetical protein